MVMWNPHSVMFEVAWCVMLYTTVLALEFSPAVCERCGWTTAKKWLHGISVPLVILGVVLSTLHQSSLGSLYLAVPTKLYPLWYSPILPIFFFLSAICTGLAMTIFEGWHSSRALHRPMHMSIMASLARVIAVLLAVLLLIRFHDLRHREVLDLLWVARPETYLFWLENGFFIIGMILMFLKPVRRSPQALYASALFVIFGFIANRLNVSITGMEASSGTYYVPKWSEIAITLSIIAIGFAVFRLAAKYLPVFEEEEGEAEPVTISTAADEYELTPQ